MFRRVNTHLTAIPLSLLFMVFIITTKFDFVFRDIILFFLVYIYSCILNLRVINSELEFKTYNPCTVLSLFFIIISRTIFSWRREFESYLLEQEGTFSVVVCFSQAQRLLSFGLRDLWFYFVWLYRPFYGWKSPYHQ